MHSINLHKIIPPSFHIIPKHYSLGIRMDLFFFLFHLNMRKNFFPLRVMEPWNRLPREVVESPSLKTFKTHLDKVLCSLL